MYRWPLVFVKFHLLLNDMTFLGLLVSTFLTYNPLFLLFLSRFLSFFRPFHCPRAVCTLVRVKRSSTHIPFMPFLLFHLFTSEQQVLLQPSVVLISQRRVPYNHRKVIYCPCVCLKETSSSQQLGTSTQMQSYFPFWKKNYIRWTVCGWWTMTVVPAVRMFQPADGINWGFFFWLRGKGESLEDELRK